jgi:hypothetical protein
VVVKAKQLLLIYGLEPAMIDKFIKGLHALRPSNTGLAERNGISAYRNIGASVV